MIGHIEKLQSKIDTLNHIFSNTITNIEFDLMASTICQIEIKMMRKVVFFFITRKLKLKKVGLIKEDNHEEDHDFYDPKDSTKDLNGLVKD